MQTLELPLWSVGQVLLQTDGAGDYRVFREPSGLYACAMREHSAGCWGVFAEGYETVSEAVEACAADLRARVGGGL